MMMHMVSVFAEFERSMLKERTKAGWTLPVKRVGLAAGGRSYPFSNRQRSGRWF